MLISLTARVWSETPRSISIGLTSTFNDQNKSSSLPSTSPHHHHLLAPQPKLQLYLSLCLDDHIDKRDESSSGGQIKRGFPALLLILETGAGDNQDFGDESQPSLDGNVQRKLMADVEGVDVCVVGDEDVDDARLVGFRGQVQRRRLVVILRRGPRGPRGRTIQTIKKMNFRRRSTHDSSPPHRRRLRNPAATSRCPSFR